MFDIEESEKKDLSNIPLNDEIESEDLTDKPLFFKRDTKSLLIDLAIWVAITAYAIALMILGTGKAGYGLSILVYVFITLRLLARHVCITKLVYIPIGNAFTAATKTLKRVPTNTLVFGFGLATLALILLVSMLTPVTQSSSLLARLQSFLGIIVMLLGTYALSIDRSAVPWHTVVVGLFLQYIIALFVLKTEAGVTIFDYIAKLVTNFLEFSADGLEFLIGKYARDNFAVNVLPAIIFFCAFISVVYYWGGMQYIIAKMGTAMMFLMDTSGSESIVAVASPFVGQGESALLVKPFVEYMTKSELHSTMVSGFATISGSILLAYIDQVKDTKLLLTSCVMSIPAGLLLSKMRYPEKEVPLTKGKVRIPPSDDDEANFLHAAGNGAATGVQLALLIFGSLLSLYSLFRAADYLFGFLFYMVEIFDWIEPTDADGFPNRVSIQLVLSYIFYPVAWLIGIPGKDARKSGELMAIKMLVNEYLAYTKLRATYFDANEISPRSFYLLTFALCGFANVASIGIQIGCLGAMAPSRKKDLAELAMSAMLTGTVATWMSAAVAGTLL